MEEITKTIFSYRCSCNLAHREPMGNFRWTDFKQIWRGSKKEAESDLINHLLVVKTNSSGWNIPPANCHAELITSFVTYRDWTLT